MKIIGYHATSRENATKILKSGFKIINSDEMFFGKGVYLSKTLEDVQYYKDRCGKKGVILRVELPEDIDVDYLEQILGIGTFQQHYKELRKNDEWILEQLCDRMIDNNLRDLPKLYKLDIDKCDLDFFQQHFPRQYNFICFKYNSGDGLDVKEFIGKIQSERKIRLFYDYFENEFRIDWASSENWARKDYYSLAEDFGEGDVGISPTQIIIYNEEVLKKAEISLLQ